MPIRGMRKPCQEGAAERDPEAEELGDGCDVGVREALVLEERHRHRARDIAWHAEAGDQQQDGERGGPSRVRSSRMGAQIVATNPARGRCGRLSEGGSGASTAATMPGSMSAPMHR